MEFEEAIAACKSGMKVRNKRWADKNAYIYFVPPTMIPVAEWDAAQSGLLTKEEQQRGYVTLCGSFAIYRDGERSHWVPTPEDMQNSWVVIA